MEIKVQAPSGGWHNVIVNGHVVAMVKSQKLAEIIAADIGTRTMIGRDPGV